MDQQPPMKMCEAGQLQGKASACASACRVQRVIMKVAMQVIVKVVVKVRVAALVLTSAFLLTTHVKAASYLDSITFPYSQQLAQPQRALWLLLDPRLFSPDCERYGLKIADCPARQELLASLNDEATWSDAQMIGLAVMGVHGAEVIEPPRALGNSVSGSHRLALTQFIASWAPAPVAVTDALRLTASVHQLAAMAVRQSPAQRHDSACPRPSNEPSASMIIALTERLAAGDTQHWPPLAGAIAIDHWGAAGLDWRSWLQAELRAAAAATHQFTAPLMIQSGPVDRNHGTTTTQQSWLAGFSWPSLHSLWRGGLAQFDADQRESVSRIWVEAEPLNAATGIALLRRNLEIPSTSKRRVYTDIDGDLRLLRGANDPQWNLLLQALEPEFNGLIAALPSLPGWLLGAGTSRFADWRRAHAGLSAPMTTQPLTVTFDTSPRASERSKNHTSNQSQAHLKTRAFVAASDGMLHTFDLDQQRLLWSYLPAAMAQAGPSQPVSFLRNFTYAHLSSRFGKPLRGLSGQWQLLQRDSNGDGIVTPATGEGAWLFGGIGRNGKGFLIADVSASAAEPSILGHVISIPSQTDDVAIAHAGATVAAPTLARIRVGGEPLVVTLAGGGFDPAYDNGTVTRPALGAQLVMRAAQPFTVAGSSTPPLGSILWWASSERNSVLAHVRQAQLRDSIVAPIQVVDLDADGFHDRFYAVDLGGRVIRGRFNPNASSAAERVLLDIWEPAVTPQADDVFYTPPSLALVSSGATEAVVAIALISGRPGAAARAMHWLEDGVTDVSASAPRLWRQWPVSEGERLIQPPLIYAGQGLYVTLTRKSECAPASEIQTYTWDRSANQPLPGQALPVTIAAPTWEVSLSLADASGQVTLMPWLGYQPLLAFRRTLASFQGTLWEQRQ